MIDNELDQLSRALIAATDRLNSEGFRERQAKLVKLEADWLEAECRYEDDRSALVTGLEADERAVEAAQAALTQHIASTYLASDLTQDEPADESDDGLFETADPEPQVSPEQLRKWEAEFFRESVSESAVYPIPNDEDEYASAKANGALS